MTCKIPFFVKSQIETELGLVYKFVLEKSVLLPVLESFLAFGICTSTEVVVSQMIYENMLMTRNCL